MSPRELLGRSGWLADVPSDVLDDVAASGRLVTLPAGSTLYSEGDAPEDLAVVVHGRLRARRAGEDGLAVHREIGRGEPVGELGLLTGEARAADVVAVRDTEVLLIPGEAVERVLAAAPHVVRSLVKVITERLRDPVRTPGRVGTVQLVPLSSRPVAETVEPLAAALIRVGATTVVVPGAGGVTSPDSPEGLRELVDRVDSDRGIALLPADDRAPWWNETSGRQADVVMLVGGGRTPQVPPPVQRLLDGLDAAGVTPSRELLLLHPDHTRVPQRTIAWLDRVPVHRHHHLREGDAAHADRVARHLLGRSQGLVLSGGGARAMAHLGAYRALREGGFPIDHVGGSSIGGVVAAQIATEADPGDLIDLDRRQFQKAAFGRRFTLPIVSIFSIRRAIPLFEALFGDLDLADTWTPCFVTAVDFTECTLEVRDRGPAATWARASGSAPGLWPPVVDERGHVMVDGGVLDNLPVDPMRRRDVTRVASVNVSVKKALSVDPSGGEVTSWTGYLGRVARTRGAPAYPNIAGLLTRLGLVTSFPAQESSVRRSDLYVEPQVDQYNIASYKAFDAIAAAGYQATAEALEAAAGSPHLEWNANPT